MYRLFENESHAEIYWQHRPPVPESIVSAIRQYSGIDKKGKLVIDVGCGSGQLTKLLSPFFDRVHGFDVSPAQIKVARAKNEADRITYEVSAAESLPVTSESVDLVTVAMAAHWFDFPTFALEVERILQPGGHLAICKYNPRVYAHHADTKLEDQLNSLLVKFQERLTPYGGKRPEVVNHFYNNLSVPFGKVQRELLTHTERVSIADLGSYFGTLGHAVAMKRVHPDLDIIGELQESLLGVLGLDMKDAEETFLDLSWDYMLCLATKSTRI